MSQLTLRQARCLFSEWFARLILHAIELGYEVAIDEVTERITEKDPTSDHMKLSLHHDGLAGDLNLYKSGVYLLTTEDHRELGEWWEEQGRILRIPLTWGGRFNDGNHYSLSWKGRR